MDRFGILAGLVPKIKVDNADTNGKSGLNFGHSLVKRATISSHSRDVQQVLDVCNLSEVLGLPIAAKENFMDMAHNDIVDGSQLHSKFTHIALMFSWCRNRLGMNLDLAFLEQIEVQVELATTAEVLSTPGNAVINAADSELMCYYYNLSESDLRRYEDQEFSIEKPLSIISNSYYKESSVVITGAGAAKKTDTFNFNCPNVIIYYYL